MKKTLFSIILLSLMLYACSEKEELQKEKISFTISQSSKELNGGRTAATDLPPGTSLLITLTNGGNPVLTRHRINILQLGDSYITDPLELAPGRYSLTEFMLVSDSSEVLFATPLNHSKLSKIVSHPLPYSFVVSRNKVANVEMEVVDAKHNAPEDFGYASFHISVVSPLSISVFRTGDNGIKFTDATAYILKDKDTLHTYALGAKVNMLSFKQDPDETYTLVIIKDGYARFTKQFKLNDLLTELNNKPLAVTLVPAFTINTGRHTWNATNFISFDFTLSEPPAEFNVNWGDGTEELVRIYALPEEDGYPYVAYVSHDFPAGAHDYFISVTGDLNKIIGYTSNSSEYLSPLLNVSALSLLKSVNLFISPIYGLVDLRKNAKLENLVLGADSVLLPIVNNLSYVRLFQEMANSVDYFIDNVYNNAVLHGTYNGTFDFSDYAYDTEEGEIHDPIKEPSESSKLKLKALRETYHWKIYPINY